MNTNEIFVVLTGTEGGKQYIQLNDISAIGILSEDEDENPIMINSENIQITEVDVFSKPDFTYLVKETPEEVMAIMEECWNILAADNYKRG